MNKKIPAGKRPAPSVPAARTTTAPPTAAATAPKAGSKTGFARQDDQAPAPSLDATWADLHPARIWPD